MCAERLLTKFSGCVPNLQAAGGKVPPGTLKPVLYVGAWGRWSLWRNRLGELARCYKVVLQSIPYFSSTYSKTFTTKLRHPIRGGKHETRLS